MTTVRFDANGLVPGIVQDARTGRVLMVAYLNEESLGLDPGNRRSAFLEPLPSGDLAQRRNQWQHLDRHGNELGL